MITFQLQPQNSITKYKENCADSLLRRDKSLEQFRVIDQNMVPNNGVWVECWTATGYRKVQQKILCKLIVDMQTTQHKAERRV